MKDSSTVHKSKDILTVWEWGGVSCSPNIVVCHPPLSMPRLSSPIPEKLPKENVLRVGDTSKWSSWSKKGTPILLCRFFPVWWNGIEPLRSRSSLRLLNCRKKRRTHLGTKIRRKIASSLQLEAKRGSPYGFDFSLNMYLLPITAACSHPNHGRKQTQYFTVCIEPGLIFEWRTGQVMAQQTVAFLGDRGYHYSIDGNPLLFCFDIWWQLSVPGRKLPAIFQRDF